jgi:hypothetical protein
LSLIAVLKLKLFFPLLWVFVQNLDEAHSSPGLHAAAGSGLAEECATYLKTETSSAFQEWFLTQSV